MPLNKEAESNLLDEQDLIQGQFFKQSLTGLNSEFSF